MPPLFPALAAPTDRIAVRVGERTLTYAELAAACANHVAMLRARGFLPGARIGVWTQPALETIVAFVAHAAAGYVSVPIDPKLGDRERAHVLADAAPVAQFAAAPAGDALAITLDTRAATLTYAEVTGVPALVLYTSGTTGAPKGAVITDRNIAADLDMLADAWAWTSADTVVHALPLFHVHGLVLGVFGSIRRGGALRWVARFTAEDLATAVREQAAASSTMLFAVPTMYHRLCEAPELAAGLRGARLLVSGSAPLPAREHHRLAQLTGHAAIERYGLTETLIICSSRHDGARRPGYVGPPLAGLEVRLVDDARAEVTAADDETIGELAVRGANVFAGYLNRADATAAVLDADGWFYTGDLATRAPDGQIRIVGRRSTDIIKCGAFKVGAGEVEAALLEHELVAEAAVLGEPDPDLGERIVAFVVTRAPVDAAALESHVVARLSPHKRPRRVVFLDALPRNAMGKVQKTLLRGR